VRSNLGWAIVGGGLALAAVALVIGVQALGTVLAGCDYTAMGLGRPLCVDNEQRAQITMVISIGGLVLGLVAAFVGQRWTRHN